MPPVVPPNTDWINNLRLVALYAVIVIHCTSVLLLQYGKVPMTDWWVANFFNACVRFAVPVFVMITGALSLQREYATISFLKKRLGRIIIPFLFWSVVYVWYSWYNEELPFSNNVWTDVKLVMHQLIYGSSYHLWYVYMLIGLYLFLPILNKYVSGASEKDILYFLSVWLLAMLFSQPYISRFSPVLDLHYFTGYAGYLVLGYYLAFKEFNFKHTRLWAVIIFVSCIILIAFGTRLVLKYPLLPGTMFYEPVNPFVVLLSSSVLIFFKYTVPKVPAVLIRIRDFIGKYNYGIYLGHALVLYFLDDPFGISYKLCTPIISIPLTALMCFIITLILVWIISKIPFGKWVSG